MIKQELMENYTAEQLAEMIIKAYEKEYCPEVLAVNIGGIPKMFTIKEVEEIIAAYEEIKLCQEQNKQCKTILPSEYLKVLTLNQAVKEKQNEIEKLQSEVEKYRKAFEDAKKERELQILVHKDKEELERVKNTINQIDDILEKLFGVRHDTVEKPDEFEKILAEKSKGNITDFLPEEPIKVADMLINAEGEYAHNAIEKAFCGKGTGTYRIFDISELREIAEYLLVYCNHNEEEPE